MLRSPQQQRDSLGSGLRGRSSLKAAAIRRGEIKISAPVTLPEQEEVVAINQPETERVETTQRDTTAPEQTRPQTTPKKALDEEDTSQKQQKPFEAHTASPSVLRNKHDSSVSRTTPPKTKGGSADMAQSYGTTSPFTSSTIASTPSKSTPIKRRKSASIKDVFRKMLGRKPKGQERSPQSRHGHNQSDPGVFTTPTKRSREIRRASPPTKRMSSIRGRDVDSFVPPVRQLPFPMNINAPEVTSPQGPHHNLEPGARVHRRRATLPSVVFSPGEIASLAAIWGATGAQVTEKDEDSARDSAQEPYIGVAVTRPLVERRRSRSADALNDMAKQQMERPGSQRSNEIRYWRTSHMQPLSEKGPLNQNAPEATRDSPESVYSTMEQPVGEIAQPDLSQIPATDEDRPVTRGKQSLKDTPMEHEPAPFDFGSLPPHTPRTPRTPQTARGPERESVLQYSPPPPVEMDERMSLLEQNMRMLQHSMSKVSSRSHRQTVILETAPRGRREPLQEPQEPPVAPISDDEEAISLLQPTPLDNDSPGSQPTFLASPSDRGNNSAVHLPQSDAALPLPRSEKATSTSTLTPSNAADAPVDKRTTAPVPAAEPFAQAPIPIEQWEAVKTILRHERASRKALESQMHVMRAELYELRGFVRQMAATKPIWRTSDAQMGMARESTTPKAERREWIATPEQAYTGTDAEEDSKRLTVASRWSRETGEYEDEESNEMATEGSRSRAQSSPDVFETPKEESEEFAFHRKGNGLAMF